MSNYKEIVTKAVISKGKKLFITTNTIGVNCPTKVLGCLVNNHTFKGKKCGNKIIIEGSYDVNIWYSLENDTKTDIIRDTNTYKEVINVRNVENITGEEIIVRELKQPSCVKTDIDGDNVTYTIEKVLGIELIGDIKVKVETSLDEDPWDEITDNCDDVDNSELNDNFIK